MVSLALYLSGRRNPSLFVWAALLEPKVWISFHFFWVYIKSCEIRWVRHSTEKCPVLFLFQTPTSHVSAPSPISRMRRGTTIGGQSPPSVCLHSSPSMIFVNVFVTKKPKISPGKTPCGYWNHSKTRLWFSQGTKKPAGVGSANLKVDFSDEYDKEFIFIYWWSSSWSSFLKVPWDAYNVIPQKSFLIQYSKFSSANGLLVSHFTINIFSYFHG
jgi:hypothetical protein